MFVGLFLVFLVLYDAFWLVACLFGLVALCLFACLLSLAAVGLRVMCFDCAVLLLLFAC